MASSTTKFAILKGHEPEVRAMVKADFADLKEKQIIAAASWTNPDAEPVIKKVLGRAPSANQPTGDSPGSESPTTATKPGLSPKRLIAADPTYGTFEYAGQIVNFQPDSDLRDNEDVPLTEGTARGANVDAVNEAYFHKEVAPHVSDLPAPTPRPGEFCVYVLECSDGA